MGKKYKLIKEYPGCYHKLGTIMECPDNASCKRYYSYKEFWEEIIEKRYEILSFKSKTGSTLILSYGNGNYGSSKNPNFLIDLNSMLNGGISVKSGDFFIHSVKRLSDGEIFTVGDKIKGTYSINESSIGYVIIKSFKIINTYHQTFQHDLKIDICTGFTNGIESFNKIQKVKQPLFTTEDGVEIFEGDTFYRLNKECSIDWKAKLTTNELIKLINSYL